MSPSLLKLLGAVICLSTVVSRGDESIDFKNDLIPVFTKYGCNAGACHGAAIGRGGFKLSLYGGDPVVDYEAVVRQLEGRRINLRSPNESLVVLKPAEELEHGGGSLFDIDSESARLLIDWIKQGAGAQPQRELERVKITPRRYVAKSLGEPVSQQVIAHYSDGTTRDVTRWTILTAEDSSAVEVDADFATLTALRRGRHIVVARYLGEVVPIELIVPLHGSNVDLTDEPRSNFVDEEILASLATLALTPSPTIDDATFLRRITLDLTGRLPATDRLDSFLEGERHTKRAALIDELLQSNEFTEYWTLQLAKLLRIRPRRKDIDATLIYHRWLAEQIRNDVSYKEIAGMLIMATGDTHVHGPANFYRTTSGPREQAEFVSELFMGSRLRCANCHNHPLDRWTQDDYHGLAAIFATVDANKIVSTNPRGVIIHPRTLEPAPARIPGESLLADASSGGREALAAWMTSAENPYFAKAIVNRLWKRMMGRGLVEPVDDFRATNPATHPALLDTLADDFVANGYSLRHTLRRIANSTTYARSSNASAKNKHDDQFYSHAARRPLEPEVLADAISDVLGVVQAYGDQPAGTRAVALIDATIPSVTLDILGRCGREGACEASSATIGSLPQKLHLFNGELLNARIAVDGSRLNELLASDKDPLAIVDQFYRVALARRPTDEEQQHWRKQLEAVAPEERRALLEDFVWGMMTCEAFVTNH